MKLEDIETLPASQEELAADKELIELALKYITKSVTSNGNGIANSLIGANGMPMLQGRYKWKIWRMLRTNPSMLGLFKSQMELVKCLEEKHQWEMGRLSHLAQGLALRECGFTDEADKLIKSYQLCTQTLADAHKQIYGEKENG